MTVSCELRSNDMLAGSFFLSIVNLQCCVSLRFTETVLSTPWLPTLEGNLKKEGKDVNI